MSKTLFTTDYYWYPRDPVWRLSVADGAFVWIECYTRSNHDDCYEDCFDLIAEHYPGAFVPVGKEHEVDPDFRPEEGLVDHTLTEHGWIASWEWTYGLVESSDVRHLRHALDHLGTMTDPDDITCALRNLAVVVKAWPNDETYRLFDANEFGLVQVWGAVEAGYWLMSHYHEGQHSEGYEALSALSEVFTPGPHSERDTCTDPEKDEEGQLEDIGAMLYAKWAALFRGDSATSLHGYLQGDK